MTSCVAEKIPNAHELIAGLMVGVVTVLLSVSLAALIFTGSLSEHLPTGIALSLFSAAVIGMVVAAGSSYAGTVAIPQDRTAPILALLVGFVATRMEAEGADPFATVVAAIALSSLVTGAVLLVLGWCRLGELIRFIPYPVIGGLLAGTGWLLLTGSLRVMTGAELTLAALPNLARPEAVLKWLPGCLLGIFLFVALRRTKSSLVMPVTLLGGAVLLHAALIACGVTLDEAQRRGLLFAGSATANLSPFRTLFSAGDVHWLAIAEQWSSLAVIVLVSSISILLNATALEVAAGQDIDLNTELRAAGAGNLLAGLGNGLVGFHSLSVSAVPLRMGLRSRVVGVVAGVLCGLMLLSGIPFLWLLPKLVAGGLLLFLGLEFLFEWVIKARSRLEPGDYAVTLLIVGVMGTVGFLQGVMVGIAAALVLFVINYSRISVVKHELSGAEHRSNVDRPITHHRILHEKGDQTYILKLQGFIFFGTAHNLLGQVRRRALDAVRARLRFVVLDFRRVTGLDSSAVASFVKMRRLAEGEGFCLVLTQLPGGIQRALELEGITEKSQVRVFPDLDHGLEMCENDILLGEVRAGAAPENTLRASLEPLWSADGEVDPFLARLEQRDVPAGEYLIRQGAPGRELYFIESGQVSARVRLADGRELRLRTMGPAAVVGEMGLYLGQPRSASVITDQPTRVYCLSLAALENMHREAPATAAAFHRFVASLLAERLAHANATLQALFD
jgi:SulP family sulfate permease